MKIARLGVLFDQHIAKEKWKNKEDSLSIYIGEILNHAGIHFEWIDSPKDIEASFDMIIIALMDEVKESSQRILDYVRNGGRIISFHSHRTLASQLGFTFEEIDSPGYAHLDGYSQLDIPLRYLEGSIWKKEAQDTLEQIGTMTNFSPTGSFLGSTLVKTNVGEGTIDHWNVNIIETIVGIQQGTGPVIRDGKPALDGSGNINDGILKADDGFELDWDFDRKQSATDTNYFAHPYADLWREVLVKHILSRIVESGLTLPFLGYWPDGVQNVATISFDSDHNIDESAFCTLDILKNENVKTTWCIIEPGYSQQVYVDAIKDGQEIAFHYNALQKQDGEWSKEAFEKQLNSIKNKTGLDKMYSNKNHYTRFEGWGDLFVWCEEHGIEVDQTRGPSKPGNIGFLFGTCQPYFPVSLHDEENRLYDVLELGFLSQDLGHPNFSDTSIIEPFLQTVKRVNGVAHFLFHQVHILNQETVREGIVELIRKAKQEGFQFWTSREINDWTRKRRQIKVESIDDLGNVKVKNDGSLSDTVVFVPISNYEDTSELTEIRFGVRCIRKVLA